ncbi:uncharacterized protein Tco025E_02722 [Trypanosoma conorhini]|uniref:Uncharacterized protein n=1 Tax=Trypanosoma conorhini TaxID=83891 RepID=A0A3R7NLP7_9TRYP|nr:uncharacterized protein Tco025E_02722 [Trypanosoma conorhini]RNF23762.1 hypothetical protein Tco025E_02722 [Trypanosoma conorhini]
MQVRMGSAPFSPSCSLLPLSHARGAGLLAVRRTYLTQMRQEAAATVRCNRDFCVSDTATRNSFFVCLFVWFYFREMTCFFFPARFVSTVHMLRSTTAVSTAMPNGMAGDSLFAANAYLGVVSSRCILSRRRRRVGKEAASLLTWLAVCCISHLPASLLACHFYSLPTPPFSIMAAAKWKKGNFASSAVCLLQGGYKYAYMDFFTLLSSSGDPVVVPRDPAIICQSTWLQAALDIGEDEGVVPVACTRTLQCLVAYMKFRAARPDDDEQEIELPISCTCSTSAAGLGYDVREMLPPCDVDFLDNCAGAGKSWPLEMQELFLELLVAADFVGHTHLRRTCAVYLACRLMSATESDILGWFEAEVGCVGEETGVGLSEDSGEGRLLLLSDQDRLQVLREMRSVLEVEE